MDTFATQIPEMKREWKSRWLALGAVAGPVLFTLAWLVLGFISTGYTLWGSRIAPYSSISQPVSGLGLGLTGPFMNAAFVCSGIMLLAGILGIALSTRPMNSVSGWICAALLALSPAGMIVCGLFTLESMRLHLGGFLLAAGTPVLSFLITGLMFRRMLNWSRFGSWMIFGSPLTLALLILFFLTFDANASGAGQGVGGLMERILILEVQVWYVALGYLVFRGSDVHPATTSSAQAERVSCCA